MKRILGVIFIVIVMFCLTTNLVLARENEGSFVKHGGDTGDTFNTSSFASFVKHGSDTGDAFNTSKEHGSYISTYDENRKYNEHQIPISQENHQYYKRSLDCYFQNPAH